MQVPIYRTKKGIWVIEGDTHRTRWVEAQGTLNIDGLIDKICCFISPGDVVVDVGANIGDHTLFYCQSVGEGGVVYAFEPDHEAFACLLLNCGFRETFFEAAAMDCEMSVGLQQQDNRGQNYVLLNSQGIKAYSIDDLALLRCDLIKIDVEGAEMRVLQGAALTIERTHPVIVIELIESQLRRFASSKSEVVSWLVGRGYELQPLRKSEKLSDDRVDVVCMPNEPNASALTN